MILHILSDQLDVRHLALVYNSLALTEQYSWLQVCSSSWLHILRLLVALVESILKILDLLVLSRKLSVLVVQVTTKAVDLAVQTIDLVLVAELSDCEVVRTVRVLELVNDTSVQLECRLVDVVSNTLIAITVQRPVHRRLNIYLPCLSLAQVECEVDTGLRSQNIIVLICTECVTPTEAVYRNNLEQTWLTLVTSKPVAQVYSTDQTNVHVASYSLRLWHVVLAVIVEVNITLSSQTEYWSEPATDTKASV